MNSVNPNQINPEEEKRKQRKKKIRKWLSIITLSLIVIWFIYYFICGMTFSDGTRSGVLTKISRKGFIFKTYEGDLNVGGISQGDGTIMPNSIFKFSVDQKSVYDQLEAAQGKKVILHYKERIKSFFWQGETTYFIHQVTFVQ